MSHRLKLYLDTSVISHLDQQDAPDKMAETLKLWEMLATGRYEVFISPVTAIELAACAEPKRSLLARYLHQIQYTELPRSDEVDNLALMYLDAGILRPKSVLDSLHLAFSSVHCCDILLSWNFKDIVTDRTVTGVKRVNSIHGYPEILIYSPKNLNTMSGR